MGSGKINGVYVELRADPRQLKADLDNAKGLVKSAAGNMSDAMGGSISSDKLKRNLNALVTDLAQLDRSSKVGADAFRHIGFSAADLGARLNLPEKQFAQLQARMLQTQAEQTQVAALKRIAQQAGLTGAEIRKLGKDMGVSKEALAKVTGGGSGASFMGGNLTAGIAGILSIATISQAGQAIYKATVEADKLSKAYTTIAGSASGARQELLYLRDESDRLGMQYQTTAEAAKGFFASGKGTALESEMRNIFSAVSEAGTALSLSQDELNGIFLALGQMISKGKVQAEELRGQLGERLPGAFSLAAKAMGVTTGELDKMLEQGQVLAEDLLPKLADAMHDKFGKAAAEAAKGAAQEVNRMSSEWESLKANVNNSDAMVSAIQRVTGVLKDANEQLIRQQMLKKGYKPEGERTFSWNDTFTFGVPVTTTSYTEAQIRAYKEYGTIIPEEINRVERAKQDAARTDYYSQKEERDIGKATSLAKDYLRGTDSYKTQEIRQKAQDAINAQKEAREQDLANAERYSRRIVEIEQERDKQLSALGKSAVNEAKKRAKEIEAANRARIEAVLDVQKVNDETARSTTEIYAEINALRQAANLFGETYSDRVATIQAATKAQEEYVKVTQNGVTIENAAAKQRATMAKLQADIDARKQQAGKTLASGFAGPSFDAEREQLIAAYSAAEQYTTDRVALERELQRKLANLETARLQKSSDSYAGLTAGLQSYATTAADQFKNLETISTNFAKNTEDALVGAFTKGELSFEAMTNGILADMARMVIRQGLTAPMMTGLSGMFASIFHDGGTVGQTAAPTRFVSPDVFAGAPRYHNGLQSGERAAILQDGEDVISIAQKARLRSMSTRAMGGDGASITMPVTIINNAGESVQASARQATTAQGGPSLEIMIDKLLAQKLATPGSATGKALRTNFGVSRQLTKR